MTTSSTSIDPAINEHIKMMTGDPAAYDAWAKTQGTKKITPDLIPDSVRQIYVNQAKDQLHPWFQNETNYGKAGLENTMGQNQADYQNTVDQLNQGLSDATSELSNSSASKGSFGSTAYQERQKSLANQYNNKFSGAYNNANANAQNALLKNEYVYGDTGNQPNLTQYGVNQTGSFATGQTAKYNPFGGQGTLNVGMQSTANQLAGDYLGARIKNPNYQISK